MVLALLNPMGPLKDSANRNAIIEDDVDIGACDKDRATNNTTGYELGQSNSDYP
jgi:hypothetical protein